MSWAGRSCAGIGRGVTFGSRDVILFMYFPRGFQQEILLTDYTDNTPRSYI